MNSPAEIRNDRFRSLEPRLRGLRLAVLEALQAHGPATTRELADRAGLSLLTVRPRVTELVELGFAACVRREGHEGVYRALSDAEIVAAHCPTVAPSDRPTGIQTEMKLS